MMDSFEQNGDFSDTQESQDTDTGRPRVARPDGAARADIFLTPESNNVGGLGYQAFVTGHPTEERVRELEEMAYRV